MLRLKELRLRKGLTQSQLAHNLDITTTQIQRYESGASYPHVETLIWLARFFGVSIDYLLGQSDIEESADIIVPISESELLFAKLSDDNKEIIISLMKQLLKKQL